MSHFLFWIDFLFLFLGCLIWIATVILPIPILFWILIFWIVVPRWSSFRSLCLRRCCQTYFCLWSCSFFLSTWSCRVSVRGSYPWTFLVYWDFSFWFFLLVFYLFTLLRFWLCWSFFFLFLFVLIILVRWWLYDFVFLIIFIFFVLVVFVWLRGRCFIVFIGNRSSGWRRVWTLVFAFCRWSRVLWGLGGYWVSRWFAG